MRRSNFLFLAAFCYVTVLPIREATAADNSLRNLVETKVYSASRKYEDPLSSPSAVYVITEDDLIQMGVHHVADALRTVPGIQVAKMGSNKWMIASRGFGEQFSNKLLVMVDGRPVYNTLFSGVIWDQLDIPISDIKQVEVIRGPGAALWGSNAVNGVVNIITKPAGETTGTNLSATTGFTSEGNNQTIVEAQHSKNITGWGNARATVRLSQDPSYSSVEHTAGFDDSWRAGSVNFRYDSDKAQSANKLSLQGAIFNGDVEQTYTFPSLVAPYSTKRQGSERSTGGYTQATLSHMNEDASLVTLNAYVDYTDWDYADVNPQYLNLGLGTQYNFNLFNNWETIVGVGYRMTSDDIGNSAYLIYDPRTYHAHFGDAYFQSKVPLVKDSLDLTIGSKVESNSYSDFALSPSAKLAWSPSHFAMFWTSWSKANRTPSRGTRSLTTIVAGSPAGYVGLVPNEDFLPETVDAYETGIRINPFTGLHVEATAFYNEYDSLRTFVAIPATPTIALPRFLSNSGSAKIKGVEVDATYQTSPALRLNAGYSYHDLRFDIDPGAVDTTFQNSARKWPVQMWNTRLAYMVSDDVTFNASAYYTGALPAIRVGNYTKIDSNLTWNVHENAALVLGVDNLMDSSHPEYSAALAGEAEEVPRIIYITYKVSL